MTDVVTDPVYETDIMFMMFPFVCVLIAVCFGSFGCAILVRRKPLIIPSVWNIVIFALIFIPQIADSLILLFKHYKKNFIDFSGISMILLAGFEDIWPSLFLLLTTSIFLLVVRIQTRGYMLIGVNEQTTRDAIHYGLQKLDISCKETRAWIELPELNTRLQIKMRSWGSYGEIKIKDWSQKAFLKKLVKHVRVYFGEQNTPIKKVAAIQYLIVGAFVMAIALSEILPQGWRGIF